jgi:uncharacterized protein YdhG (YjbR/CyaY superfamily)
VTSTGIFPVWTSQRSTLKQLRRDVVAVLADAQECLAYAAPGFQMNGTTIAGLAALKKHLG